MTNVAKMISLFDRVEHTVRKGENAFIPFPTVFSKAFLFRVFKSWDCVVELRLLGQKNPVFPIRGKKTPCVSYYMPPKK